MNRLREHRKRLGMTQAQVAEAIGCHQSRIAEHELGTSGISAEQLAKYAVLYGCKMDDLYQLQPEQPTQEQAAS